MLHDENRKEHFRALYRYRKATCQWPNQSTCDQIKRSAIIGLDIVEGHWRPLQVSGLQWLERVKGQELALEGKDARAHRRALSRSFA